MNDNAGSYETVQTLTVTELMTRWRMPRKQILAAIREGKLHAFRVGKRWYRVAIDEVLRFEKGEVAA